MSIETIGGVATRGEAYAKLMHHIREAQEQAAVMAHLHNTEGNDMDKLLAQGWLGVSELFKMIAERVTKMAMKRLN